jgi:hypothetical protein
VKNSVRSFFFARMVKAIMGEMIAEDKFYLVLKFLKFMEAS